MSEITKALREEMKERGLMTGRTYSSNSNGQRRIKVWCIPPGAYAYLDFVARQHGAVNCEMIKTPHTGFEIVSFVAYFPLGADGQIKPPKPKRIKLTPQKDLFKTVEVRVAKTTVELRDILANAWRLADGSWNVVKGPYGHASIILYDKDGNEACEICNKD